VDQCNESLCYNVLLTAILLITLYIVFSDSFHHASRQLFRARHAAAAAHLPHRSLHIPDSKETDSKENGEEWPTERDFLPPTWRGPLLWRVPRALFKCLCRW
jgi:hypothetical protein